MKDIVLEAERLLFGDCVAIGVHWENEVFKGLYVDKGRFYVTGGNIKEGMNTAEALRVLGSAMRVFKDSDDLIAAHGWGKVVVPESIWVAFEKWLAES